MIRRVQGRCTLVEGLEALIECDGFPLSFGVLVPSHLAGRLRGDVAVEGPQQVTLHTLEVIEGQATGGNLTPRIIGFESAQELRFFELFTKTRGLGARKALKAMAQPPAWIAAAIERRDAKALTQLPEIGKRLAETLIAELSGKLEPFGASPEAASTPAAPASSAAETAISTLIALGETRADAERLVAKASGLTETDDPEALVAAAYAHR